MHVHSLGIGWFSRVLNHISVEKGTIWNSGELAEGMFPQHDEGHNQQTCPQHDQGRHAPASTRATCSRKAKGENTATANDSFKKDIRRDSDTTNGKPGAR